MNQVLADAVLLVHFLFVVFIVGGMPLILVGGMRQWPWVRNWWFRAVHLGCISIVVAQSWFGLICPLTSLEMRLRFQAGNDQYIGSFIQYWLQRILFYEAPAWIFILVYTVFGCLILFSWIRFPPRRSSEL